MGRKVLIVDDDKSIVVALRFLMEQNGCETIVAFSGEEAMDVLSRCKPDIILLDIMLPRADGFEICQRIRENLEYRDIRIILLTAHGNEINAVRGIALGADAYITKPFANADLLSKVNELLACHA